MQAKRNQLPRVHYCWDGEKFLHLSPEDAKRLVDEDRGQDLTERRVSATELRPRKAFTGYSRRVLKPVEAVKSEEVPIASKPISDHPLKNWSAYRGIAARDIGKPANRVTKADVEAWWSERQGDG
jgi:hypothetical protein